MLPTGDIQGGLRKLESLIRTIKYTGSLNYNGLSNGDPAAFLPIVSYTLTTFSPVVAEQLVTSGFELSGKTDLRFIETVFKVLRDVFQYKPVLTKEQFLQWGFSQRKISVVCDIINLVLQRHNQHKKSRVRPHFTRIFEKAQYIKAKYINTTPSNIVSHSVQVERFTSQSPEHGVIEVRGAEEEEEEEEDVAIKQCVGSAQIV
uniref:Centrosomal protein of 44 kDa n=1 Tax=Neogobius melanostomus TaxID=47308 RepID=A0A8C6U742_9GOBI